MGRKPVPTKLKIMRGNPGQRRLNAKEPAPSPGPALPPPHITGELSELWHEMAPPVEAMGLLTTADSVPFAQLVCLEHTARELLPLVHVDRGAMTDFLKLQPALARLYRDFGLTPSARATMTIGRSEGNPLNEFLAGG